jgi:hypothetical protein
VIHSRLLGVSQDGRTTVELTVAETPDGSDAAQIYIETDPSITFSAAELDGFAAMLSAAAGQARMIVAEGLK